MHFAQRRAPFVALLGAVVLLAVFPAPANAYPRPGITERVSVASDGAEGNSHSGAPTAEPDISADGRYVVFESLASNLVPGDTNNAGDVFISDRVAGTTERVSVASDATEGNGTSYYPTISADGRHVAFQSGASNLVPNDTNGFVDVFVHDRVTGTTGRVSVASDGAEGNGFSAFAAISPEGRYVAFVSGASNLVPGDTNDWNDVFVHDRETGNTERVSVASDGTETDGNSFYPALSADGRYVAFVSNATNLVPDDTNGFLDVFVRDRESGNTERVSVAPDGAEGNEASFILPTISADGRYVAFVSGASNLVPNDTNNTWDAFVRDRETGNTERVSVASDGGEGNSTSFTPTISSDGRYVAFSSLASNLVPFDTNSTWDVFVHDREAKATERVSVASDGAQANAESSLGSQTAISADGRHVAFHSNASNLVPFDTNTTWDVFVHDRGPVTGVGDLVAERGSGELVASGWATFSGRTVAAADDSADDGAEPVGAEITGASVVFRPEQEDVLLQLRLESLPLWIVRAGGTVVPGGPGIVYRWKLTAEETAYEVRALRTAATASSPTADPYFALYECAPSCVETTQLSGGIGTTGAEVRVSVPLEALTLEEGSTLTAIEASAALGEVAPGPLTTIDEVGLPDAPIPLTRVDLGIAPDSTSEDEVDFVTRADLAEGNFSGSLDVSYLTAGDYDIWARACLGEVCGAASEPVTLGEPTVEIKNTNLELTVEGRGQSITLKARLTELDVPQDPIAGRTIDFYSDGELIGADVTNNDGIASVSVPPGHRGNNRTYEAVFAGDDFYLGSADERAGKGGNGGGSGAESEGGRIYSGRTLLM